MQDKMAAAVAEREVIQPQTYDPRNRFISVLISENFPSELQHVDPRNIKRSFKRDSHDEYKEYKFRDTSSFERCLRLTADRLKRHRNRRFPFHSLILFILSHGSEGDLLKASNESLGIAVKRAVLDSFSVENLGERRDMPLLCFVSSCRGTSSNEAVLPSAESECATPEASREKKPSSDQEHQLAIPSKHGDEERCVSNVIHNLIVMGAVEGCVTPWCPEGSLLIYRLCKQWSRGPNVEDVLKRIRQEDPEWPTDVPTFGAVPSTCHDTLTSYFPTQ